MNKFLLAFISLLSAPSFAAETINVSEPACFLLEFQALESAVAQIKNKAIDLCARTTGNGSTAVITETRVEQTASCHGFNISAVVECV
jgi:hypothetical protein